MAARAWEDREMAPRKTTKATAKKATTRRTTTRRKAKSEVEEEIPEVCDHSLENGKKLSCVSNRLDKVSQDVITMRDNHLAHLKGDVEELKADSKETKEKLHEMHVEQAGIQSDVKNLVQRGDRSDKRMDQTNRTLNRILWFLIGGGGLTLASINLEPIMKLLGAALGAG